MESINKNEKLLEKYKKSTLKDNDFTDLHLSLHLYNEDKLKIMAKIEHDSKFLQSYNLTDYSLLLSIHIYIEEEYEKYKDIPTIFKSSDGNFIYCFSIIDFLCVIFYFIFLKINLLIYYSTII